MSGNTRTYFDYNASAPLLDCAREAMINSLSQAGNPSSVHFEGRNARKLVEVARRQLAKLIDVTPANIIFTSGATESVNHILTPVLRAGGQTIECSKLYAMATEHPCILNGGRFAPDDVVCLPVDENGVLDIDHLGKLLHEHDETVGSPLVAVQYANSETGVIQPLEQVAEIVHAHDGFLVVDAVQALAKIPFTLAETGADFLIVSSHKIGGPQGAGALVLANGALSPMPLLRGGGQENYHRGGTENVAAISGFGAACEWHEENLTKTLNKSDLRDSIERELSTISRESGNAVAQPIFFGESAARLGNTSCFSVDGLRAETALVALDLEGISVSSGSACSSGKVNRSHVLEAMGANENEMAGALRVSIGWNSTQEDAKRFLDAWKTIIGRMAA